MRDATRPDIFVLNATSEAGAVVSQVKERMKAEYTHLNPIQSFIPVSLRPREFLGQKPCLVQELGGQLACVTGKVRSTNFPIQRLSVA